MLSTRRRGDRQDSLTKDLGFRRRRGFFQQHHPSTKHPFSCPLGSSASLEPQLFLQDLSQGEKLWCLAAKTLLPPTRSSHQAWRNPQPQVLGPCRDRRVSTSSYELSGLGNPEELSTESCPCPSAHQDPLDQSSAPHGIRPCLLPTPTKNALRSNLPRYQRFFFFPAGNDNPNSVLKTILWTRVAPKGIFVLWGTGAEPRPHGAPQRTTRTAPARWGPSGSKAWGSDC